MTPARILIVDDEAAVRKTVRICLEMAGYQCAEASDGRQAMEAMVHAPPELVLLDLAMPFKDGMTFLTELRSMEPRPNVRVIVMTAHGSVRVAINAIRLGASDFLEKPFLPDDLRLSITSVLNEAPDDAEALAPGYSDVLNLVGKALRDGRFVDAERLLMRAGTIADSDPEFLNLAGALHEAHGRKPSARRFYERALASDATFEPAAENLRRLYDLETRGRTDRKLALGNRAEASTDFSGDIGTNRLDRLRSCLEHK